MNNLGIPPYRRRGIAWQDGDQARNRPPANLDYFRAAGYEVARLSAPAYPGAPQGKVYVQNQADVLFYIGHGSHSANYVFLSGSDEAQGHPDLINTNGYWNHGLQTVIFFACSVLDINNYDGCADDNGSPGTEWIALAGPKTWLGFKWTAPTGEQGRAQIRKFAAEYVASGNWITAWRTATGDNIKAFRHAVAIDDTNYYYWDCPISINDPRGTGCWCLGAPTWETIPRTDLNSSTQGLELLVASPVEVHVYDALGRHVGPNAQGGLDLEIPGAAYWTPIVAGDPHPDARRVSIPAADLSHAYQITLVGTATGQFDFYLEAPDRATGALYHANYLSVTVAAGDTFALSLQRGADFRLAADRDGDGVFEGYVTPSAVSSREIDLPLALVLQGTTGAQGWYRSAVVASLHGSTRPGVPLLTSAEVDLGSGWQPYTTPLTFTQEGAHTLHYRGVFAGGLQDVEQWVSFRLDTTPPVLTLTTPTAITYTLCPYTGTAYTGALTVTYQAHDTVAGLDWVSATLSGVAITNGQTLETLFWPPGPHELVVTAQDRAGWQTVYRQSLFIQAQIEDLDCALDRLAGLDLIIGPAAEVVLTDLHNTLAAAQAARDDGDVSGAVTHLHTFVLDVVAQSPAPISPEATRILARAAQYVTNRLGGQIVIPPAFGGQLTSPAFDVTVTFPANAVTATTVANYRAITSTPPISLPRFSPVFELTALDYDSAEASTHFQHPVTICVTYGDGTVSGLGEQWLALHTWDSPNHEWVMLPTSLDRPRDQATTLVTHFSIYALLEQDYRSIFLPLVTRMWGGAQ